MVDVIRSKSRQKTRPSYEFGLEFYRGNDPEVHEFKAYPQVDAGSLSYTLSATRKPERAVEGLVRSIRKMLADDDGTPANYTPKRYQPDVPPESQDDDLTEDDAAPDPPDEFEELDEDTLYVGPHGEPLDAETAREAMRVEHGSSLRRFSYLMDEDEDLTLELDQLQTAYQRLLGKAANRPTRR